MSNTSAAKGKRWERELREGFRSAGLDVESLRLAGKEDEGDMVLRDRGPGRIVVEAKNAVFEPSTFVKEALAEADNYAAHRAYPRDEVLAISIIKRRGKGWKDAYVLTTVRELFGLE